MMAHSIWILTPFPALPQVLHCCVSGSTLHTQQSHYLLSLSDLSPDYDLMLGQVKSFEPPPSQTTSSDFGNLLTVAEGKEMEPSWFPLFTPRCARDCTGLADKTAMAIYWLYRTCAFVCVCVWYLSHHCLEDYLWSILGHTSSFPFLCFWPQTTEKISPKKGLEGKASSEKPIHLEPLH